MNVLFMRADINEVADRLWGQIGDRKVVAIHGEMGSGKTTLVHALCDVKNVTSTVGSPTFSIINEYKSPGGKIFHIDLYRLKDENEAMQAGVEDCLYSGNVCLVEWPDRAPSLFPDDTLHIHLQAVDSETRELTVRH